jgi:hypothetical protein
VLLLKMLRCTRSAAGVAVLLALLLPLVVVAAAASIDPAPQPVKL